MTIFKVEEQDCGDLTLRLKNNCGEASAEMKLIIMRKFIYINHIKKLKISNLRQKKILKICQATIYHFQKVQEISRSIISPLKNKHNFHDFSLS